MTMTPGANNQSMRKGERRKLELILAAIRLVHEKGVESLSHDSLGKAAGLKRAHVAYYFKKKEHIILEVIQFIAMSARDHVDQHVSSCESSKKLIDYYIDAHMMWIDERPDHGSVYLLFYYYSSFNPMYRQLNKNIRHAGAQRIARLLEQADICSSSQSKQTLFIANHLQQMLLASLIDSITLEVSVKEEFTSLKKKFRRFIELQKT